MSDNNNEITNYKKGLFDDYKYSIDKFDQQLLYIASGALAISLTFIKDIVPIENAINLYWFYSSLWLFTITILLSFVAHFISALLIKKRINDASKNIFKERKIEVIIPIFNISNIIFLILGVSTLVYFSITNIQNFKKPDNKENYQIKFETKDSTGKYILIEGNPNKIKIIDTLQKSKLKN